MNRHWLRIVSVLCLIAGCQPQAKEPVPQALPLAGQTVELIAPADLDLKDHWEPLLQEWRAQTGGEVTWTEVEPGDFWTTTPKDSPSGGRVLLLALSDLADADSHGWLSPLPASVVNVVDQRDIFPGLKDGALSRQKKLVAVPISAPVLLCYYRKDLLDAAELKPPKTWDDYQQLVEQLPQWAPGLTAVEPCGPEFRASLFLARCVAFARHPDNYSVWFDIQTGLPLFDSPAFERALDTARAAWKLMPTEIWTYTPADCRRELLTGKAAIGLCYEPSADYPRPKSPDMAAAPETPMSIGAAQLPGSTSVYQSGAKRWETTPEVRQPGFVGFTGLVMGVQADDERAAAWNLLQTLVERRDLAFAERPRSICRESEANTLISESPDLSPETASLIADATAETLRRKDVTFDLAVSGAGAIRQAIAAELDAARDDASPTVDILAAIQRRVSELTKDRRDELRDEYRRSVGLGPVK